MLPGKKYTPEDILKILRQRYWLILLPFVLVAAGTAAVARRLPDMYKSTATIQVVPPQVPDNIVRSVSTGNFLDRLQATQQTILSRTRLERVINDFNLYADDRKNKIMEEVVESMRKDITVTPYKGDTFQVAYVGRNPVTVMKVTERLAAYFKDESQIEGERRAEGTNSFVESQVEEKRRELKAVEDKLTAYELSHAGELPTQMGGSIQAIQTINQSRNNIAQQIAADQNTKTMLQHEIEALETTGELPTTPVPAGADPMVTGTTAQKLAAAQQLLAQAKLQGMAPGHPDMKFLERTVADLQKQVNDEALRAPVSVAAAVSPAEKAKRDKLAQWHDELDQVEKRLAANQAEEQRLKEAAGAYQARVNQMPVRDAELKELTRDYETLNQIYKDMLQKRETSAASVNLERRQIGEQFNLLDQARVPEKPFSPDRWYINMFGFAGGLALGLALVALLEYRDRTFKTDGEISSVLSLPVLAVVPLMRSEIERKSEFRRKLLLNLGLGSTMMVALAVLAYALVR